LEGASKTLQLNTLFRDGDDDLYTEYFPTKILSENPTDLLSALQDLNRAMDDAGDSFNLHHLLEEIATAAYEAGRRNIVPPDE